MDTKIIVYMVNHDLKFNLKVTIRTLVEIDFPGAKLDFEKITDPTIEKTTYVKLPTQTGKAGSLQKRLDQLSPSLDIPVIESD